MKYKVQLLNYDSEWVDYCNAPTKFYAQQAYNDLREVHNFQPHQIRVLGK